MTTTREQVRKLTAQGFSVREIATLLGLSTQAIYLHIKAIRAEGSSRKAAS